MDFFEYASVAQLFVNTNSWYVPLIVGGLCFLIVFAFQAVGLFIISGREGYKHRWMAFVPFFNTYYIGVCGQKNRAFKSVDTKIFSLLAAILDAVLVVGFIIYYVAEYKLLEAGCIYEVVQETAYGISIPEYVLKGVPASLAWAGWCFEYLDRFVLSFVQLAYLVFEVFTLSAFFQTFAARRYMLFTITSILFPVQGIIIFILRNNGGMNYREYIRREQERQYRMYQQYRREQSFDQNPYNQNPYSRNPYEGEFGGHDAPNGNSRGGSDSSDDPFSEFGGNSGGNDNNDPFAN